MATYRLAKLHAPESVEDFCTPGMYVFLLPRVNHDDHQKSERVISVKWHTRLQHSSFETAQNGNTKDENTKPRVEEKHQISKDTGSFYF